MDQNSQNKQTPSIEIKAKDDSMEVGVEMPDVSEEEITISSDDGQIRIEGRTPPGEPNYEVSLETEPKISASEINPSVEDEQASIKLPINPDDGSISVETE